MKMVKSCFVYVLLFVFLGTFLGACKKKDPIGPDSEELTVEEAYETLEPLIGSYDFTTSVYQVDINNDVVRYSVDYQGTISIEDTLGQRIRVEYRPGTSFSWKITDSFVEGTCYNKTFTYSNNRVSYQSEKHSSGTPCSLGIVTSVTLVTGDKL